MLLTFPNLPGRSLQSQKNGDTKVVEWVNLEEDRPRPVVDNGSTSLVASAAGVFSHLPYFNELYNAGSERRRA